MFFFTSPVSGGAAVGNVGDGVDVDKVGDVGDGVIGDGIGGVGSTLALIGRIVCVCAPAHEAV